MDLGLEEEEVSKPSFVGRFFNGISMRFQTLLDRTVPHVLKRWTFTLVLFVLYFIRVYILQGWYIITYALGIYLLNLLIGFLTSKIDPQRVQHDFYDYEQSDDEDNMALPTKNDEEFRPFIRKLPEFKFWYAGTKAFVVAFFCTFFEAFNVPVFWPILVMYFCILFVLTMKRQIKHMIKYKYLPFTYGKRKYAGKPEDAVGGAPVEKENK